MSHSPLNFNFISYVSKMLYLPLQVDLHLSISEHINTSRIVHLAWNKKSFTFQKLKHNISLRPVSQSHSQIFSLLLWIILFLILLFQIWFQCANSLRCSTWHSNFIHFIHVQTHSKFFFRLAGNIVDPHHIPYSCPYLVEHSTFWSTVFHKYSKFQT